MRRLLSFGLRRAFARDRRGVSAIEFALVFPILSLIVFGGYQVSQAASAYRKVTRTARVVADLTTQYSTMSRSDVSVVLNASSQLMAPFDPSTISIVLTQFAVSSLGIATVAWSQALNGTALMSGSTVNIPVGICLPNASVVLATVTYKYNPVVGSKIIGPIAISSSLYMSPRSVTSISYTGG